MERIQALIDKLVQQQAVQASPAQLLLTVHMLQSELVQLQSTSKVLGTAKVAVTMPARVDIRTTHEPAPQPGAAHPQAAPAPAAETASAPTFARQESTPAPQPSVPEKAAAPALEYNEPVAPPAAPAEASQLMADTLPPPPPEHLRFQPKLQPEVPAPEPQPQPSYHTSSPAYTLRKPVIMDEPRADEQPTTPQQPRVQQQPAAFHPQPAAEPPANQPKPAVEPQPAQAQPQPQPVAAQAPVPQQPRPSIPATLFDPIEAPTLAQHQPAPVAPAKEIHELIGSQQESLNDRLKQEQKELAHMLKDTPVKDLRKAIGINDRFTFVNELFRGDEAMYERSIRTINGFNILPEAEYWINRELKVKLGWNDNKDTVQHFYHLVRRRFA